MAVHIDIGAVLPHVGVYPVIDLGKAHVVVQHSQLVDVLTVQLFLCNFGLDFRIIIVGFHHVQVIVWSRDAVQIDHICAVKQLS